MGISTLDRPAVTDAPVVAPAVAPSDVKLTVAEQDTLVATTQAETGKPSSVPSPGRSGESRAWSAPEPARVSID